MSLSTRTCRHIREDGTPCRAWPMKGEDYCFWHSPGRQDEAEEARRLGGLRRRREKTVAGAYEFQGLATVTDIRRLLEVAVIDTLSLENLVARSRTLAYLSQTALKCIEVGELEERLGLLESIIRTRVDSPTSSSPPCDFDLDLDIDEDYEPKELMP